MSGFTFKEFQRTARDTAIFPADSAAQGFAYCVLGLNGEAGEVAEHAKKILRDDQGEITEARRQKIKKELGDVLWYLAMAADQAGLELHEVARANHEKLRMRAASGHLHGEGSNR